ncbi:tRNA (adenosine(37)-N6)-threonylcarbamoyltransferase complex ATPase subunit type 1 TsaE [Bizionia sediminis]|uniref:tRNA threonylcarbamoyladenosine biosynthesis protein TsaE n=1 Tax=Bizionia sediminis TaxID=1737064 RepID=A0ABW5KQM1_9FLAO
MIVNYNIEAINTVAQQVLDAATNKVLLFHGDMGTGKTTLIKAILQQLGSTDVVSSPTFSLVNTYDTGSGPVYHFDLYRLETVEEAYDFGIEEYLSSPHWIFIEWPELISDLLPPSYHSICLTLVNNETRQLQFK